MAIRMYSFLSSLRNTAILLQVSHTTVRRWLMSPHRKPYPKRAAPKTDVLRHCLRTMVSNDPFVSTRRAQSIIRTVTGNEVSRQLICSVLKAYGYTRKKARFHSRPARCDEDTVRFVCQRDQFVAENRRFVSLDETSFGRNGRPVHGYAPRGDPLFVRNSRTRMTTTSALAAVDTSGRVQMVKKTGSFNKIDFVNAIQRFDLRSRDIVLLDNVAFHHSKIVRDYANSIEVELLFVPPYSPWFNPIEGVFSVVKHHFHIHGLVDDAFHAVSSEHVKSFFRKSFSLRRGPHLLERRA